MVWEYGTWYKEKKSWEDGWTEIKSPKFTFKLLKVSELKKKASSLEYIEN